MNIDPAMDTTGANMSMATTQPQQPTTQQQPPGQQQQAPVQNGFSQAGNVFI
jgi:hypothetical protein